MTLALTDVVAVGQTWLWYAYLVFLRVGASVALLPGLGDQMVPLRIRLGLALALSTLVVAMDPGRQLSVDAQFTAARVLSLSFSEIIVGLTVGIGLRMFVFSLQVAGSIAAQATSLAQIFAGAAAEPQPAISNVLVIAALCLAMMSDLHIRFVELMALTYDIFPQGGFPSSPDLSEWGVRRVARAFELAFVLAAPFVILSFLYNVTLGVINRAMPQLMVAFVGAPALTGLSLVLLALCAPFMLDVWSSDLFQFFLNPIGPHENGR